MTDKQVRSDEARRTLRYLLDEVARGAHITILRYDQPAAVLVPVKWHEDVLSALPELAEIALRGMQAGQHDPGSAP